MKRFFTLCLCLLLFGTALPAAAASGDYFIDRETLNVVYLGGSITEGAGASSNTLCWASLITEKLKKRFPQKEIAAHNAGIGGTGSNFGLYRLQRDVCSYEPDLVFVEFAVNDRSEAKEYTQKHMEGIVRQLLALPKTPAIVFVYTSLDTHKTDEFGALVEITPRPVCDYHEEIAQYYGIASINLERFLYDEYLPTHPDVTGEDVFTDHVHPTDFGHSLYTSYIWDSICADEARFYTPVALKETPLTGYEYQKPQLVPAAVCSLSGNWQMEALPGNKFASSILTTTQQGATATFQFTGRSFGLLTHRSGDTYGTISYSIDGGTPIQLAESAADLSMAYTGLVENLSDGPHTVVFTNVSDKKVNLAMFFVDCSQTYPSTYPNFLEYREDFSAFSPSSWESFFSDANYSVEDGILAVNNPSSSWIEAQTNVSASGIVNVSFDLNRTKLENNFIKVMTKFNSDSQYQDIMGVTNDNRGVYIRDKNQTAIFFQEEPYSAYLPESSWHTISARLNFYDHTIKLFVDGIEAQYFNGEANLGYLPLNSSYTGFSGLMLQIGSGASGVFLDNIQVTDERMDVIRGINALPQTVTLEDKSAVYDLVSRRDTLLASGTSLTDIPNNDVLNAAFDTILSWDSFLLNVNLTATMTNNRANCGQVFTYQDVDHFTQEVTGVFVNNQKLDPSEYIFHYGKLWIGGSRFPHAGNYLVEIESIGHDTISSLLPIVDSGIVYTRRDLNFSTNLSEGDQVLESPSVPGYGGEMTNYVTVGNSSFQWKVTDAGTYDLYVWRVCHPTAGTKYLQVQVQHKDGSFTSEPIDCVDEIENGGFVRIGSFSFSGDGSEYVRLQLAPGHDAQFLRSSAMMLSLPAVDGKDEFYADDPVLIGTPTISGQTVTVPLTCRNSSGIRDCIAICASYDESGRLVEMGSLSLELLSPGTPQNISFSFSTPQDALAHKVFVWNSFLSAAPRMRAVGKQQ